MRRYVLPALLGLPSLFALVAYGCGSSEPPIEDLCGWLQDPANCYRRFGQDMRQNGPTECTQLSGANNAVPQIGAFQARDTLAVCILREGGLITFDTPVDLTMLPPKEVAFKFINTDMTECGSVDYLASDNFSMTIDGALVDDAGVAAQGGVIGGTFKIVPTTPQPSRQTVTVTCPSGETHYFDTLEANKCVAYQALQPSAALTIVNGGLDQDGNPGGDFGAIEFSLFLPPTDGDLMNAKPDEIKYFTCLFPAVAPICANGIQDPGETDVDCGGSFCQTRCAAMQKCISNSDCASQMCTPVKGLKQCVGGGSGSGGAGGGGGAGGSGGAGTTNATSTTSATSTTATGS